MYQLYKKEPICAKNYKKNYISKKNYTILYQKVKYFTRKCTFVPDSINFYTPIQILLESMNLYQK